MEKEGLQEPEGTPQNETPPEDGTPSEETPKQEETTDWEKRYKDLQADHTQTKQRLAQLEEQAQQPSEETPAEETPDYYDEEGFVDAKTVQQMIKAHVSQAVQAVRLETANSYFRKTYPELVKHESVISGLLRTPKNPASLKGKSPEDRIDAAVKEFNALLEEAKTEAADQAAKAASDKAEQNRKAAGLGGGPTPAPKSDDEGESDQDYLESRKARLRKQRGLA